MTDSQRAHPHSQLRRPHCTSPNGTWRFFYAIDALPEHEARELQAIEVTLP